MSRNIVKYFIAIAIIFSIASGSANAKMKIGVVEFEERNKIGLDGANKVIPEILSESLVNVGVYDVTERLLLIKVLQEQELGMTGVVDTKSAPKIGKVYGLEAIVTGSYMKAADEIIINARLIDTTTGQVKTASTVKFKDINEIQSQIEIVANELSGISRENLKVKKEDIQKSKVRAGILIGAGFGNADPGDTAISIPIGFFFNSKWFNYDFMGGAPTDTAKQIVYILTGPGVNISRYFGLGAGYAYCFSDPADFGNEDVLSSGEERYKGEYNAVYFNVRIRPSYKFIINVTGGINIGTKISARKDAPGSDDIWLEYEDSKLFSDIPGAVFGLSVDYLFTEQWGIRAFVVQFSAKGEWKDGDINGQKPDDKEQYLNTLIIGCAASYSFSFGGGD